MSEKRVNIDPITVKLVNNLKKHAGVKTSNEIVGNGISILNWAVDQVLAGRRIGSVDPMTREVELFTMPILDRVEHSKNKIPQ